MTDRMSHFTYDYLPTGCVRLLEHIEGGNEHGHSVFRMRTYHMNNAPTFNALSYVWGSSSDPPMRPLSFISNSNPEGAPISIAANLYEALPILTAFSKRPLWVDALCINQSDEEEKGRVVSKMGELYGNAEEVLIWLGPHRDGSILAMDVLCWLSYPARRQQLELTIRAADHSIGSSCLANILEVLLREERIYSTESDIKRLALPSRDHPLWLALPALYSREWFSRSWTFQEAMLAKNSTVLCGDRSMPWERFLQLAQKLSDTQLLWINQPSGTFSHIHSFTSDVRDSTAFWVGLVAAKTKGCTLKEDRVFALLALAPDTVRRDVPVIYSRDPDHYITVYRSLAISLLKIANLELILGEAAHVEKPPSMPSWCPDWSQPSISIRGLPSCKADPKLMQHRAWMVDAQDESILKVRGMEIDHIQEVVDDYSWYWPTGVQGVGGPADKMLTWLNQCLDLARCTIASEKGCEEAFWQTLFAYTKDDNNQSKFPSDPVLGLQAYRKRLAESRECVPLSKTALSPEELNAYGRTIDHLGFTWRGRVFFSTVNGRIGIGDRGVKKNDSVCLLFGAPAVYILRARGQNEFSFQSMGYVHGLMLGGKEHLGTDPEDPRAQTFRLR